MAFHESTETERREALAFAQNSSRIESLPPAADGTLPIVEAAMKGTITIKAAIAQIAAMARAEGARGEVPASPHKQVA